MSAATKRVLDRLAAVRFEVREGGVTPFGEGLPLVSGVAWDRDTAQMAFVAEATGTLDADAWRQLLFAASGLRHHLGGERPSAFGTPLVLALVDSAGERGLRRLVEDLTSRYAVFNRVDLNLVRESDLADDDALDTALAPLLPSCRTMLGETIARQDVQRFWRVLRANVAEAAQQLDTVFGDLRQDAADELADALIGPSESDEELAAPSPANWLELENFRSFAEGRLEFEQITVVHGANGSGKSSVLEALELLWAHTSQRCPPGVPAAEYARHLPRGGSGAFTVRGKLVDEDAVRAVERVADQPLAELQRSVLTQEAVAALVNNAPAERYAQLLAVTGLQVPELEPRTRQLVDNAKIEADAALRDAGLPPLPRANVRGLDHLRSALAGGFARRMPSGDELVVAASAVARASDGAFEVPEWPGEKAALDALLRVDAVLNAVTTELGARSDVGDVLDDASRIVHEVAAPRRDAARALRVLVDAMDTVRGRETVEERPQPREPGPISPELAARWLSHAESMERAARRFREDAALLPASTWKERLLAYADALDAASGMTPRDELDAFTRAAAAPVPRRDVTVGEERFVAAGFARVPDRAEELVPVLRELLADLERHADVLETLAAELEQHPARDFAQRGGKTVAAICRFELARHLRRQRPILLASEELLRELLAGRLYPVVRELVAAMVRFEWYFEPLRVTVDGREVLIGGLATPHANLDARMLLNSAERTVVGLAWFLALHLLQPLERRRVLVLDDPAGAFDAVNRAGFVSTLRAFVRLARPEQVVIAAHDDGVAGLLAEELSPVADWPSAVTVLRCQRDENDASVVLVEQVPAGRADLGAEEEMLGLGGEPTLFS